MKIPAYIFAIFQLLLLNEAMAEQIQLKNGDIITGALLGAENGITRIQTEYAGVLEINSEFISTDAGKPGEESTHPEDASGTAQEPSGPAADATPTHEKKRFENWSGNFNLGGHWESAGSKKMSVDVDSMALYEIDGTKITVQGRFGYGESDGEVDARNWESSAQWRRYLQDKFYLYALAEAEMDDARKLDLRLEGTLGVGYHAIKNDRSSLSLGMGVGVTHEKWNPYSLTDKDDIKNSRREQSKAFIGAIVDEIENGNVIPSVALAIQLLGATLVYQDPFRFEESDPREYMNARITLQYEQALLKDSKIEEVLTLLPNLEDYGEYRAKSELTYSKPISEKMQFRLRLVNEFDSLAGEKGIETLKSDLTASLGFVF